MDGIIEFDLIKNQASNIIKVIGVGGGGGNAVKNMYSQGIKDVSFAICNTDSQALSRSNVPTKIQLGDTGLGAGGNPEKGRAAAETSIEQIKALFNDTTQMVFITAGMGGGTGTGAAPIIAHIAKEMGILTIGIVTIPFQFEMKPKIVKAIKGVNEMKENVDALLVINNERLREIYADGITTAKEAFCKADDILTTATKSIAEIITIEGTINRDFCDVETIMKDGGSAIMAMGRAKGKYRIQNAILDALNSPLLNDNDIEKAQKLLYIIYSS
ncbi:cell division protein FtsZ, partial [Bacteroides ovatus]